MVRSSLARHPPLVPTALLAHSAPTHGTPKPTDPKPTAGYRDSSADIAYVLRNRCGINVLTPTASPDPHTDEGWCFADTEQGIIDAVQKSATHLWANTILFAQHPLQTSTKLAAARDARSLRVVGQPPRFVELFDDKNLVNTLLGRYPGLTLPKAITVTQVSGLQSKLAAAKLCPPFVGKPVRGRGSHGVKVCRTTAELESHVCGLLAESAEVLIEEYLAGQEATVTVMPPSAARPRHWALPVVTRFNHQDGIAPYNGVVAVTTNSRVVSRAEFDSEPTYADVARQCERVAQLLQCTAPIRVDVRRFREDERECPFALFDVNMKPVS